MKKAILALCLLISVVSFGIYASVNLAKIMKARGGAAIRKNITGSAQILDNTTAHWTGIAECGRTAECERDSDCSFSDVTSACANQIYVGLCAQKAAANGTLFGRAPVTAPTACACTDKICTASTR